MQIHFEAGELVFIAVLLLVALFWLIPSIVKGIFKRLKGLSGKRN